MEEFPFLRLPSIPQSKIFRFMSNEERLDAALTSKIMRKLLQADPKTRVKYELSVSLRSCEVLVSGVRSYYPSQLVEGKEYSKTTVIKGNVIPTEYETSSQPNHPDRKVLYFEKNKLNVGFHKMYWYLHNKLEITTVRRLEGPINNVFPFLQSIKKHGVAVKEIHLNDKEISIKQAEAIFTFQFLKDLIYCHCDATPPMAFRAQQFPEPISIKTLFLKSSRWFNINHLLTLKFSENIVLEESNLSSRDINVFMTEWKNGKYGNLASITIKTTRKNKLDFDVISLNLADQEKGVVIGDNESNCFMKNEQGEEAQVWVSENQFRCKIVLTIMIE